LEICLDFQISKFPNSGNLTGIESRLTSRQLRKAALITAAVVPLIRALGATYRWRAEGLEHYDAIVASGKQPILAFWHGRIMPATYFFRRRGIVVITSQNFDGEWIARVIERFGYETARGSTSHGAQRALINLVRAMRDGKPTGFTLDGPRRPARVAQPGAVWLASATGNPVLPFHLEASRHWTTDSWDHTQIPKPFSTVALAVGEPLVVPPETADSALEEYRRKLEARLARLQERAREMLNR